MIICLECRWHKVEERYYGDDKKNTKYYDVVCTNPNKDKAVTYDDDDDDCEPQIDKNICFEELA